MHEKQHNYVCIPVLIENDIEWFTKSCIIMRLNNVKHAALVNNAPKFQGKLTIITINLIYLTQQNSNYY